MNRSRILSTAIFSLLASRADALTLDEVRDSILKDSPQVRILDAELDASRGEALAGLGAFDLKLKGDFTRYQGYYDYSVSGLRLEQPVSTFGLDFFAGFRSGQGNIPVYDQKFLTLDGGEWSAGFSLPLLQNFAVDGRRFGLLKAENSLKQKQMQVSQGMLEQTRQGMHRFLDWVVARYRLEIQQDLEKRAVDRGGWLQARVEHGDIPRFELEDNRRSILQRETQVRQAELQSDQAKREFAILYGVEEELLAGTPEMPSHPPETKRSLQEWLGAGLSNRKDLAAVSVQLDTLKEESRYETNRRLPKLDLKFQADRDLGDGSSSLKGTKWTAGLGLDFPLWQRSGRGRSASADAQAVKTEVQSELLKRRIETDIRNANQGLRIATERYSISKKEYELATHLEEGERTRFKNGESSILTVNLREQATVEARLRMIEALAEAWKNSISLSVFAGAEPR